MDFIKGVTFGFMSQRGEWEDEEAFGSLRLLRSVVQSTMSFLQWLSNSRPSILRKLNGRLIASYRIGK